MRIFIHNGTFKKKMLTFSFLKLYAKMKFKFFNSFKKKSYKPYKIKFEFLKFINLISLPIKQHFKMHTINKMRKHYFNRDRATINHQPINRKFVKRKSTTVTKSLISQQVDQPASYSNVWFNRNPSSGHR